MAEDDDFLLPELALRIGEQLTAMRLRGEDAKEGRRDEHALDSLGLAEPAAADREAGLTEERLLLDRGHVAAAIEVVGDAVRPARIDAGARVFVEHPDEPVGLREGQRLQQHAADYRKDRDIGREAKRQRCHRGD